ncbi:hypothetical protein EJ08DRAFT_699457 [Tothia fuscella]|uniref:Uncharacterized protein n=1 Tax=Tothia fuscella TaxID=1048955 RepID=A0A9P4NM25_9PEZI|nr:hypothetical protein EJ08DRAFT_699457 [Tothia fuscella]
MVKKQSQYSSDCASTSWNLPISGFRSRVAYVPPHLRNKTAVASKPDTPSKQEDNFFTVRDILYHYCRKDDENRDTAADSTQATLNATPDSKGKLAYVCLFHDSNPRWESGNIIFVKSNLGLLPGYGEAEKPWGKVSGEVEKPWGKVSGEDSGIGAEEGVEKTGDGKITGGDAEIKREDAKPSDEDEKRTAGMIKEPQPPPGHHDSTQKASEPALPLQDIPALDITPTATTPIAVFEEQSQGFLFLGYYKITNIALLVPFSTALTRMLEQKWQPKFDKYRKSKQKARDAESWKKSFSVEWAVIRFEKMVEGGEEDVPAAPKIENAPVIGRGRGDASGKSVNEMLAELRVNEGGAKDEENDGGEEKKEVE